MNAHNNQKQPDNFDETFKAKVRKNLNKDTTNKSSNILYR